MSKLHLKILISLFLLAGLGFIYSKLDYSEKFYLLSIDLSFFKLNEIDSSRNCLVLEPINNFFTNDDEIIVAVKFSLGFTSENHEGFEFFNSPRILGNGGHNDSIVCVDILNSEHRSILKYISGPVASKFFRFQNDSLINGHTFDGMSKCLECNNFNSLNDVKDFYNSSSFVNNKMSDLFLFNLKFPSGKKSFFNVKDFILTKHVALKPLLEN